MTFLFCRASHAQLMGDREDHMDIVDWQQFCPASVEPSFASVGLALRAMPGTARVEGDGFLAALAAPIQVSSKGCRAAPFDGDQYADVHPRQPGPVLFNEAAPASTDNISHLERWPVHFLCSFRERFSWPKSLMSMSVSGRFAAFKWCRDRCR